MRIAFIGAHQDDEMSCLCTFLKYRAAGHSLSFICVTNGDKGISDDPTVPWADASEIRDREMRKVARAFEAEYLCLNEPDEALTDTWDVRVKLIEAIRITKPELIFTHFHHDYNMDHVVTSQLVFQAALLSTVFSIQTESDVLKEVPRIYYVDPGPGFGFEGTHFVECDEGIVRRAMRILGYHKSQMAVAARMLGGDYRQGIKERLKATGARVGRAFAEGFVPCLATRRTPLANMLPG